MPVSNVLEVPPSIIELLAETSLARFDVEAFSDVEVTSVPLEAMAVVTELAAEAELVGIDETMAIDVPLELAGDACLISSCCVLTPFPPAIAIALGVEFACLVKLQAGFANAGNGQIKDTPTART
jgi:hypothetical protein